MVSEMKDSTARVFDRMSDGFRTAFEVGRKSQDAWFKTMSDAWGRMPGDNQRMVGEWAPFVGKQMETAAQAYDASLRSGLDVFRAAVDIAVRPGDGDPYEATRNFWDTAFGAARTNFDVLGQAGARAMEDCANFCESFWRQENPPRRPAPSQGTAPTSGPKSPRSAD